jgi:Alpha-2-macroglobulin bait region domain
LSKAVLIQADTVTGPASTTHQLTVGVDNTLAQRLAPSARIVAWYITVHGEIVSDSLDFTVDGAFANQVMTETYVTYGYAWPV